MAKIKKEKEIKAELMQTEVVLNVEQYGLQESKAKDIEKLYIPMISALNEMESEFNALVVQEVSKELSAEARDLRLRIVKVRTGADKARKEAKAEYLRAGNAIQGAYSTLEYAVKSKEAKLLAIEKHYENIENERIAKLQEEREKTLTEYEVEFIQDGLGNLDDEVWERYLDGIKLAYNTRIEAEKKAEEERMKKAKEEAERVKRIEAEAEKLRAETEKLRAEAAERDRIAKVEEEKKRKAEVERAEKERVELLKKQKEEQDRAAKEQARIKEEQDKYEKKLKEEKAKADKLLAELKKVEDEKERKKNAALAEKEADAAKNDEAKVLDLIEDIKALKSKYSFTSTKYVRMYLDFGNLADKTVMHINSFQK